MEEYEVYLHYKLKSKLTLTPNGTVLLGYAETKPHIRKKMKQKRKRTCQQVWLKQLMGG